MIMYTFEFKKLLFCKKVVWFIVTFIVFISQKFLFIDPSINTLSRN